MPRRPPLDKARVVDIKADLSAQDRMYLDQLNSRYGSCNQCVKRSADLLRRNPGQGTARTLAEEYHSYCRGPRHAKR